MFILKYPLKLRGPILESPVLGSKQIELSHTM